MLTTTEVIKLGVAGLLAVALLAPSTAVAAERPSPKARTSACSCLPFVKAFGRYTRVRTAFQRQMNARWMPPLLTRRLNDRIVTYSGWGRVDHEKDGWCKRYPKTCRALKMCLAASATAFASAKFAGKSDRQAGTEAATYCALAVATVIWIA